MCKSKTPRPSRRVGIELTSLGALALTAIILLVFSPSDVARDDDPAAAASSAATPSAAELDLAPLFEAIEAEGNNDGEFPDELSLIYGGGQTVHEQSIFEQWWYSLQGFLENGGEPPGTFP